MFSKEASEEARLDEKGWKDKKSKDEAARRERTGKKEGKDKAAIWKGRSTAYRSSDLYDTEQHKSNFCIASVNDVAVGRIYDAYLCEWIE